MTEKRPEHEAGRDPLEQTMPFGGAEAKPASSRGAEAGRGASRNVKAGEESELGSGRDGTETLSKEKTENNASSEKNAAEAEAVKEEKSPDGKEEKRPEKKAETSAESREGKEKTVPKVPRAQAAGRARPAPGDRPRPAAKKEEEKPLPPSPMQPLLDRFVALVKEKVGAEAVEEAYINRPSGHVPTLVIRREHWEKTAELLRYDPELAFDYLRNLSGVDYQTHMEVEYQFLSFTNKHQVAVRVKTDREEASLPSVARLWKAADWNER
jgi:NADH-quinone oxidoreductase subunit C